MVEQADAPVSGGPAVVEGCTRVKVGAGRGLIDCPRFRNGESSNAGNIGNAGGAQWTGLP